jgi:hypothetical protein
VAFAPVVGADQNHDVGHCVVYKERDLAPSATVWHPSRRATSTVGARDERDQCIHGVLACSVPVDPLDPPLNRVSGYMDRLSTPAELKIGRGDHS